MSNDENGGGKMPRNGPEAKMLEPAYPYAAPTTCIPLCIHTTAFILYKHFSQPLAIMASGVQVVGLERHRRHRRAVGSVGSVGAFFLLAEPINLLLKQQNMASEIFRLTAISVGPVGAP